MVRLGFLGTGWIGRHRMGASIDAGASAVAIADPSPRDVDEALKLAPDACIVPSLDAMLDMDLDGVVIATPSALHAEQAIAALDRGIPVFCQKPLGRNLAEVEAVLAAARRADRLIGVDLSYRHAAAIQPVRDAVRAGRLGRIYGVDLIFHNAYGPDKAWFYDPALSGGGCLIDLGVHLIDLALWVLDFPPVASVSGRLLAGGRPLTDRSTQVEDYAVAEMLLADGTPIRIATSWRLPAGQEAVITAEFYGTDGGAALRNIGGSFYDFAAFRYSGTTAETLVTPPDDWGGRAARRWVEQLAKNRRYDAGADGFADVTRILDAIYEGALSGIREDVEAVR